jgi:hypothetical protein
MRTGDRIEIREGPFAKLAGTLAGYAGERVIVTLELNRGLQVEEIQVEMDADWIEPADARRRSPSRAEGGSIRGQNSA